MGELQQRLLVTVASVALLGLLQGGRAMPNPDFGTSANINPGRSEVVREAADLAAAFGNLDDTTVLVLNGGYSVLADVQTAIEHVGVELQEAGTTLAQQLASLATNSMPNNVDGAFQPVYAVIGALEDLMASGLDGQLSSLRSLTGRFIPRKLRDAFGAMREALEQLVYRLHALQDGVAGPRPSKVSIRVQNGVAAAIREVRSRVGAIRYMVRGTLYSLHTADEFLADVKDEARYAVAAMQSGTLAEFSESVGELREDVADYVRSSISCLFASQLSGLATVLGELSPVSGYSASLQSSVDTIASTFSPSSVSSALGTLDAFFTEYVSGAAELQSSLGHFFGSKTCELVRETVMVLVAGGPYNKYCFHKHSDRVYNLYELHLHAASKCYELEYRRLTTLADTLEDLVDLILYDVEALVDRLAVCASLRRNKPACVAALGGLYQSLVVLLQSKTGLFFELTQQELTASYNRLGACVTSARCSTAYSADAILRYLKRCKEHGVPHGGSNETRERDGTNETNETNETQEANDAIDSSEST